MWNDPLGCCETCFRLDRAAPLERFKMGCVSYKCAAHVCADCKEKQDPRTFFFFHRASTFYTTRVKTFRSYRVPLVWWVRAYLDECDMICENCVRERIKPSTDYTWACPNCLAPGDSKKAWRKPHCHNCKNAAYWKRNELHREAQYRSVGLRRKCPDYLLDENGNPYFI